jgi:hypothetical protein
MTMNGELHDPNAADAADAASNSFEAPNGRRVNRRLAAGILAVAVAAGGFQFRRARNANNDRFVPQIPVQPLVNANPPPITALNASQLRWTGAWSYSQKVFVVAVSENNRFGVVLVGSSQAVVVDLQSGKAVASSFGADSLDYFRQNVWVSNKGVAAFPLDEHIRLVSARGTQIVLCKGMYRQAAGAAKGDIVAFVNPRQKTVGCVINSASAKLIERTVVSDLKPIENVKRPSTLFRLPLKSFGGPVDVGFFELQPKPVTNVRELDRYDPRYWVDRQGDPTDDLSPIVVPQTLSAGSQSSQGTYKNTKTGELIPMPGPFESIGSDAIVLVDGQLHVFDLQAQKLLPAFADLGSTEQRRARRRPIGVAKSASRSEAIRVEESSEDSKMGTVSFADGSQKRWNGSTLMSFDASNDGTVQAWIVGTATSDSAILSLRSTIRGQTITLPVTGLSSSVAPLGADQIAVIDDTRFLTIGPDLNVRSMPLGMETDRRTLSPSAAGSPDGSLLAVVSLRTLSTRSLIVFRTSDGKQLANLPLEADLPTVSTLSWSPDGKRLVLGEESEDRWQVEFTVVPAANAKA